MTTRYDRHIVHPKTSKLAILLSVVAGVVVVAVLVLIYNLRTLTPWEDYTGTDGSFRVAIPARPLEESAGHMLYKNQFTDFMCVDRVPLAADVAPEFAFLAEQTQVVARCRGKLIYERDLDVGGCKAHEFQVERPIPMAARVTARLIATKTSLWIVSCDIVEGPGADEDARHFIDSFKILK